MGRRARGGAGGAEGGATTTGKAWLKYCWHYCLAPWLKTSDGSDKLPDVVSSRVGLAAASPNPGSAPRGGSREEGRRGQQRN